MEELYRVNDIVLYTTGYDNGRPNDVYAKIVKIEWKGDEYNQLHVTTGYGDANTRCLIDIEYICKKDTLEIIEGCGAFNLDPHKIHKLSFNYEIQKCVDIIELNKKKLEFFEKYENLSRDKIIDGILEET